MGKEPNTVKANLVEKFRNILAQDSHVEFQPSDFHGDTDSTIQALFDHRLMTEFNVSLHKARYFPVLSLEVLPSKRVSNLI